EIGAERGARRGNSHKAEGERMGAPLAGRVLNEQPSDQSAGAIGVREQSLKIRVEHARSVARPTAAATRGEPFLPRRERFSSGIDEFAEVSWRAPKACAAM